MHKKYYSSIYLLIFHFQFYPSDHQVGRKFRYISSYFGVLFPVSHPPSLPLSCVKTSEAITMNSTRFRKEQEDICSSVIGLQCSFLHFLPLSWPPCSPDPQASCTCISLMSKARKLKVYGFSKPVVLN